MFLWESSTRTLMTVFLVASNVIAREIPQYNVSPAPEKDGAPPVPVSFDLLAKFDGVYDYLRHMMKSVQDIVWEKMPYPTECMECFEGLGCFDACNGTFNHTRLLPDTPEQINTTFNLFPWYDNQTVILLNHTDVSGLNQRIFENTDRGLLIVNHGFAADSRSDWMNQLKNMVIEHRHHNVILVDWLNGASPYEIFYPLAVVNSEVVGRQIAVLVHGLMLTYGVRPVTIHYVGHSLGAQCGHFFAIYFKKLSGGLKINRITALDAAAPLFEAYNIGLNSSDAIFVDAIHTSAGDSILRGRLGVYRPIGHVDYYVKGGTYHPGCWTIDPVCAHARAHEYYVEAVYNQLNNLPCKFSSHACLNGIGGYNNGTCISSIRNNSRIAYDMLPSTGNGIQYLETNAAPPFCKINKDSETLGNLLTSLRENRGREQLIHKRVGRRDGKISRLSV